MLFSVIIPTYNPKKYISTMLNSIINNECINDIEIIISDDCSDEPFDEVLENYKDYNIRVIKNDMRMGFPRLGRQNGLNAANGTWVTFADQDDYYIEGSFDKVKAFIEEKDAHNYIISDFISYDLLSGSQKLVDGNKAWTHGKFYEKQFLTNNEIFYDDVQYNEDVNFSSKVACVLIDKGIVEQKIDDVLYVWCRTGESLCTVDYFRRSIGDHAKATLGVIIKYIDKYRDNQELLGHYCIRFIHGLFHEYFAMQSILLNHDPQLTINAYKGIKPFYIQFKILTKLDAASINDLVQSDLLDMYNQTRVEDNEQFRLFEQISFKDWLYNLE